MDERSSRKPQRNSTPLAHGDHPALSSFVVDGEQLLLSTGKLPTFRFSSSRLQIPVEYENSRIARLRSPKAVVGVLGWMILIISSAVRAGPRRAGGSPSGSSEDRQRTSSPADRRPARPPQHITPTFEALEIPAEAE